MSDDFPYKRLFLRQEDVDTSVLNDAYVTIYREPLNEKSLGSGFTWIFEGQKNLVIISSDKHYKKINYLTDLFTENARMRASVIGQPSPYDFWQMNKQVIKEKNKTIEAQREYIYEKTAEATNFKINVVVALFRFLGSRVVLDPSAGWGDRALGAHFAGVTLYHGIDPNTSLTEGYSEILKYINNPNFNIVSDDFLKVTLRGKYDTVFTSPPYFNYEKYSNDVEQSIHNRSNNFNDWKENFYRPYLEKAYSALESGGWFCLYVSDNNVIRGLTSATHEIMNSLNASYSGVIGLVSSSVDEKTIIYPIWIWRKP